MRSAHERPGRRHLIVSRAKSAKNARYSFVKKRDGLRDRSVRPFPRFRSYVANPTCWKTFQAEVGRVLGCFVGLRRVTVGKRRLPEVVQEKQPMSYFPIYLDMKGRRCLVIGGGTVAERKIASLLEAGAQVTVISPDVTETIARWSKGGSIQFQARRYEGADINGHELVFVA